MEKVETQPKIHVDEGETKEQVVFGGVRSTAFIKKIVAGESVDGKRYRFNGELIFAIHDRVSMVPGFHGFLRQTNSTTVGGEPVGKYEELDWKMQLFGRWLQEEMEKLQNHPEDLIMALEIASAAHYGLSMPTFHPFDNGNGRTARALVNAILMSQSYELTAHHLAIPPLPILRPESDGNKYIHALRSVGKTGNLNPLMNFLASRWIRSLDERLEKINRIVKKPKSADQRLIEKLEGRKELLQEFLHAGSEKTNGSNHQVKIFPVPDYFATRYIKVSNAQTF